ncbi:hypothetical protein AOLI_G00056800 [Acnodon oligacanthus]
MLPSVLAPCVLCPALRAPRAAPSFLMEELLRISPPSGCTGSAPGPRASPPAPGATSLSPLNPAHSHSPPGPKCSGSPRGGRAGLPKVWSERHPGTFYQKRAVSTCNPWHGQRIPFPLLPFLIPPIHQDLLFPSADLGGSYPRDLLVAADR